MSAARCPGCGRVGAMVGAPCACGRFAVEPRAIAESSGDPALGREVLGRFILLGPIAHGARSAVHDALDRRAGDRCVVKVIRERGEGGAGLRALEREAGLLRAAPAGVTPAARAVGAETLAARDPALAPVSLAVLALDRVDGQPLDAAFVEPGADRAGLARAFLVALGRLHEAGIIHGDIKPAHARVTETGAIVLLDLGSGRRIADLGPVEDDAVTSAYAAPERHRGPSVASDLFAWGRVVSRAAAGSLDGALAAAVARATAPEPEARPASAEALLGSLPGP